MTSAALDRWPGSGRQLPTKLTLPSNTASPSSVIHICEGR